MNAGSERNIISICLKNQDKILECENEGLYPEHFIVDANKYVYMAIVYLFSKKVKPTPMAIYEVLTDPKAKEALKDIGGLEYLTTLNDIDIYEDNLSIYAQKIRQAHMRKMLYEICSETQSFVLSNASEVLNPTELLSNLETKVVDLSTKCTSSDDVYKMGDETDSVLAARAENPDVVPGIETGWTQFDRYTSGGQPGDLIVVCARSKTGKSVTLTNFATKFSIIDKMPVLYIDTEMNHREQEDRILANLSGVPHNEITNGMYVVDTEHGKGVDKISAIRKAKNMLTEGNYYHVYMPQFTLEKVTALARKFKMQYNIAALFFDYIKIPANQLASLKAAQEWQMLGFFTSGLKDIGGMLNIPVYTAAQENRNDVDGQNKNASNVGGSDRILQLATKLCFLYNKSDEQIAKQGIVNGNQQLYIAYQRNGECDCPPINIKFTKTLLRQEEV